jgi:carbon storage regulator
MLVLTRRKNDEILIGGRVVVKVLRIRGSSVQIGIEAPDEVDILRRELTIPVQEEGGPAEKEGPGGGPSAPADPPALPSGEGPAASQTLPGGSDPWDRLRWRWHPAWDASDEAICGTLADVVG